MNTRAGAALVAAILTGAGAHAQAGRPLSGNEAREIAGQAIAKQAGGQFAAGRGLLVGALVWCRDRECRVVINSALGDLHRREAGHDRRNAESLYGQATQFFDDVLREVPDDPDALYGKALVYRSMGPHEWQQPFYRDAAARDPGRRALYHSFEGDYYGAQGRWNQAVTAFQRALEVDADDAGARSGLVEALRALGPRGVPELLSRGAEWEAQSPEDAADAYGAALGGALSAVPSDTLAAGRAFVGLVSVQARNGRALGALPPDVPADWKVARELQLFLKDARPGAVRWWGARPDRRDALALAVLARGRQLVAEGGPEGAEAFWRVGADVAPPPSSVRLDLQRELAMLYVRHPGIDPDGRKFAALEHEIFVGKGEALAAGDLEAAQRYHTALGLIYAQRGAWRGPRARNAVDQLTWALTTAEERNERERFYQPLPDLKALLASGLDSLGDRERARALYRNAAAAYVDLDDIAGAVRNLRSAERLGALWQRPEPAESVVKYMQSRPTPDAVQPTPTYQCTGDAPDAWVRTAAALGGTFGTSDFMTRQRFKVLAECAQVADVAARLRYALRAFSIVDAGGVTLVGGGDIRRFGRVMSTILGSVGLTHEAVHLDRAQPRSGPSIPVSLPAETKAFWLAVPSDAMVAARVVAALGTEVRVSRVRVAAGVVDLYAPAGVPPSVVERLRRVSGVQGVRVVPQTP